MWKRFLRAFAITGAAALALVIALVLLVDPLGVSPVALFESQSRLLADGIAASSFSISSAASSFDSFLVGSSTIHSVDPDWAETAFGGAFANLSIHGALRMNLPECSRPLGEAGPAANHRARP